MKHFMLPRNRNPKGRSRSFPGRASFSVNLVILRDRGTPFKFKLGQGQVIKGWDEGYFCPALAKAVRTMKKGEKVILTVKPQYAFGESGRSASGDEGAVCYQEGS